MSTSLGDLCSQPLHPEAERGIGLFDTRHYFEAHEALENAWRIETGSLRDLYRAILQVGVAYYHIERGNYRGARKMFHRYRRWIRPFPPRCCGIDIVAFCYDADEVEKELIRLGPEHINDLDLSLLKPVPRNTVGFDR